MPRRRRASAPTNRSFALKQTEPATPLSAVCRKRGISDATFYNWRTKFGGL
ncbi:transposase family protein [Azotobacter vinelandii CA]|uniref:Transposase family protein n=2 Tax=Azotobacter vinelandii TaxID=354 RepID=C1DPV3_AZOVD|nr:transposase family protein [Azotobacter vinelandii DJ]AGK14653.1 transposase family protein [Azotobacter vinelandii CA]AGK21294.1 transposase family protein [Azotobacter vinelandii CA6]